MVGRQTLRVYTNYLVVRSEKPTEREGVSLVYESNIETLYNV